jgi:hypothetical protein
MDAFPNLISEVCKTEKTVKHVTTSIPILIRWAKSGSTTNTYGDLIKELGMTRFSGIGYVLGSIDDVLRALGNKINQDIPTLNALVCGKNGLPSYGFEYINQQYPSMSIADQKLYVDGVNKKTVDYPNWDVVLQLLGLKPSIVTSAKDEASIRSGKSHGSGEGPKHKALKEFIFAHPESIGIRNVVKSDTEYILLSGDRLDVYFEQKDGTRIAVEVKSIVSPDDDILRGLYQCVKYKAILDAENKTHGTFGNTRSLLVIEGALSESNQQVKDSLGITVIEGLKIK